MPQLRPFEFPLQQEYAPDGFALSQHSISAASSTVEFQTGLDQRDVFLNMIVCLICGVSITHHCHIIMQSEQHKWIDLKERQWIPEGAKNNPSHEPRNGLSLCPTHHVMFDSYQFFIRFYPQSKKFIFINHSEEPMLQQFHGKALPLDVKHRYTPFPSIFIIHEMRVYGHNPFRPLDYDIPDDVPWQDWVSSMGAFDQDSNSFRRDKPPRTSSSFNLTGAQQSQIPMGGLINTTGTQRLQPLNNDVIAEILAATRAMPSWKACEMEDTSWDGTAEENIEKYISQNSLHESAD